MPIFRFVAAKILRLKASKKAGKNIFLKWKAIQKRKESRFYLQNKAIEIPILRRMSLGIPINNIHIMSLLNVFVINLFLKTPGINLGLQAVLFGNGMMKLTLKSMKMRRIIRRRENWQKKSWKKDIG